MLARQPKTVPVMAVVAVALLLISGCSSSKKSPAASPAKPSPSPSAAASPSAATGAGAGTSVTATETEFHIALSQSTFKPGAYTFKVVNGGKFPHNLTIEGPGVDKTASPTLQGGGTGAVTVTLAAGTYELWCTVDSHKSKGMDMKITVA